MLGGIQFWREGAGGRLLELEYFFLGERMLLVEDNLTLVDSTVDRPHGPCSW